MSNCPFDGACCPLSLGEAACALAARRGCRLSDGHRFRLGCLREGGRRPRLLYDLKHRDAGKPVAWLVEGPETLDVYGRDVPAYARRLAETFWPGALTLVVRASAAVPAAFRSPAGTIGLRMPTARRLSPSSVPSAVPWPSPRPTSRERPIRPGSKISMGLSWRAPRCVPSR